MFRALFWEIFGSRYRYTNLWLLEGYFKRLTWSFCLQLGSGSSESNNLRLLCSYCLFINIIRGTCIF